MANIYWRGDPVTGNGLWNDSGNWVYSNGSPAPVPTLNDRAYFSTFHPSGAIVKVNSGYNFNTGAIYAVGEVNKVVVQLEETATRGTISVRQHSFFSDKVFFDLNDNGIGVELATFLNAPLTFNGNQENYVGLGAIRLRNSSNITVEPPGDLTALRNTTLLVENSSRAQQTIRITGANHFKGLHFNGNAKTDIDIPNSKIIVDPSLTFNEPIELFSGTMFQSIFKTDIDMEVRYQGPQGVMINNSNDIEVNNLVINAKKVLVGKSSTVVNGDLKLIGVDEIEMSAGTSLRTMGVLEANEGIHLKNKTLGAKANFSQGSARPGPHVGSLTFNGWTVKDVQSDSNNITIEGGTDGGNTAGFEFISGGPLPTEETAIVTSTINPIAFGIVKTTEVSIKAQTEVVTYSVEPLTFSATAEGINILDEVRDVGSSINPINFTVAAEGMKIAIEDRAINMQINPIDFSTTAIPMKQQIEERLVEIQVSPVNFTATARELKTKVQKSTINIQALPIVFSATAEEHSIKTDDRAVTSTIGEIFLSVETLEQKVKNETREIISYVSPIRMKVTSYSVGMVKKYVAKVTVIDTNRPHFIYVKESKSMIELIGKGGS